jgi:hypothetical protein
VSDRAVIEDTLARLSRHETLHDYEALPPLHTIGTQGGNHGLVGIRERVALYEST